MQHRLKPARPTRVRKFRLALTIGLTIATLAAPARADGRDDVPPPPKKEAAGDVTVFRSAPVTPFVFDGDVRDLPRTRRWQPGDPVKEIPRRKYIEPGRKMVDIPIYEGTDRLLELAAAAIRSAEDRAIETPDRNFPGAPFSGANPPDTSGEVGLNHYIQTVNGGGTQVRIYDKALPTPNLLATFQMESLATGGSCAGGLGDPIVMYDRAADRWVLTEFSSGGNNLCFYISQTPDPVSGGWFAYGFAKPSFPDYPKYGVWATDANGGAGSYISTTNETTSGVYAYERARMLAGDPATFQRFTIADLPGFPFNAVTPADHDGLDGPVTGAPAVIMRQRDTEVHSGPAAPEDVLEIWHLDVDWVDEANTTFTQLADIDVAEFSSELCGLSAFACFEQPGSGTTLDPLREVIMNRLQYRNFGDYEVLVGNFVTDVDGTERGGVRWFELRRTGGISQPWTLFQEGLISPDSDSRFMAASAMDQSGNIAVAYNVTSSTTFPSLRYSGRLADDPLGTTPFGEYPIADGSAANSSNRYGDYSAMGVDPADDCTFWFTGMYNTSSSWSTQIASFRFEACGCDLAPLPLTLGGGNNGDNRVDLTWNDSELETVVEYRIQRSRTQGGPYTTIATVPDSSPGVGGGAGYAYSDETVSGGITYHYVVTASDGGACRSDNSNEISVEATGACLLPPVFAGAADVSTTNNLICELQVSWDAASSQCGGSITYDVYGSTDPGLLPGGSTLLQAGLSDLFYLDNNQLVDGQEYFYLVRATDTGNGVTETNEVKLSAMPEGLLQAPVFVDDGGDTGVAQLTPTGPWSLEAAGGNFGDGAYSTGDYGSDTCAGLTTPPIALGSGNVLEFWSRYDIEDNWDKGEVQISSDGVNWSRVEVDYPLVATQASDECGFPSGIGFFSGTNNDWQRYTADLTAFAGQTVQLRFQMSSDGSVTESGWWIDDIVVGTLPETCATASSCADNPIVDVTPNGPQTVCSLAIPELSADTTGGTGPFTYQWYDGGAPIPDATGPTFQPTGPGNYNVRVQAQTCPDQVADGQATVIATESTARFNGLTSIDNPKTETCGIDLTWDEATSLCPGPIVYNVYRAQGTSVEAVPGNLVASALPTAGYTDSAGVASGVDYTYLVEAVETSTGLADGNDVQLTSVATGPDQLSFSDDAGDSSAAQLTPTLPWTLDPAGGNEGPGRYTTGTYGNDECADVRTGSFSLGVASTLQFATIHEIEGGWDKGEVQISIDGGTIWERVELAYPLTATGTQNTDSCGFPGSTPYFSGDSTTWTEYSADLTPWGGGDALLRWQFGSDGSVTDAGWSIDDIRVFSPQACSTASTGPAPVPDGRNGTTPLRADRNGPTGDVIDVTWDTSSCTATEYNLLYGDLSNVSTVTLDGAACSIGTTGSLTWSVPSPGSLFFLIVGVDGVGTESSWGRDSLNLERNGSTPSDFCAVSIKDATASCP